MGDYDIRLKDAFGREGKHLGDFLFGEQIDSYITTRLLRGDPREADLLARLRDGSILHLEFQTGNEVEMPWRMLNYRVAMMDRESNWKPPLVAMRQIVLYFGLHRNSMPCCLITKEIHFGFEVRDIRSAVPRGSRVDRRNSFEKNLLIALASGRLEGRSWKTDSAQWEELVIIAGSMQTKERRSDCLRMAEVFAVLRGVEDFVRNLIERYRSMPIDVDIEGTHFTKQVFDQGIAVGYDRAYHDISDELFSLKASLKRRLIRLGANEEQAATSAGLSLASVTELIRLLDDGEDAVAALRGMNLISGGLDFD